MTITNSTFSGNSAYYGGGISDGNFSEDVPVTIVNSTIVGNTAFDSADYGGGGIFFYGGDHDSDPTSVDALTLSSTGMTRRGSTGRQGQR